MNKNTTLAASIILVLAVLGPVSAYHITGAPVGPLTSGDWTTVAGNPIFCESDGPMDDRNARPIPGPGVNGLCTTGENSVTGVMPPSYMTNAMGQIVGDLQKKYIPDSTVAAGDNDVPRKFVSSPAILWVDSNGNPGVRDAGDSYYADNDNNGMVSNGDTRMSDGSTLDCDGMGPDDSDCGATVAGTVARADNHPSTGNPAPDGVDPSDDLYHDADASGDVSAGDKRLTLVVANEYVRIDACNTLTLIRGAGGPCFDAMMSPGGRTDEHGWSAEVGAFSCFVPTNREPLPLSTADFAVYYDRLYAWWSYDGDGWYTDTGTPNTGSTLDNDGPTHPNTNTDDHRGFHGHVAMFIQPTRSMTGHSTTGSAETALQSEYKWGADWAASGFGAGLLSDAPSLGLGGGGTYENSCGASPACPPTDPAVYLGGPDPAHEMCDVERFGIYGPVIRGPNVGDPQGSGIPDNPSAIIGQCDPGDDGAYVLSSVDVTLPGTFSYSEGAVVLLPGGLPNIGGGCVARGMDVEVTTALSAGLLGGEAWAACLDLDNNGICADPLGLGDHTFPACDDVMRYNHEESIVHALSNPGDVDSWLPGAAALGCSGFLNHWVVFACSGAHTAGISGLHTHGAAEGTVTGVAAGSSGPTFDNGNNSPFCDPSGVFNRLYFQL